MLFTISKEKRGEKKVKRRCSRDAAYGTSAASARITRAEPRGHLDSSREAVAYRDIESRFGGGQPGL